MKVFVQQHQCPGDILMLTSGVRDLKAACPTVSVNVETTAQTLWDNNPNLDRTVTAGNADRVIRIGYPLIHQSDRLPYHFVHAFRKELEIQTGLRIPQGAFRGEVFLTDAEKRALPAISGLDRYWILDAGHKRDFPLKYWGIENFQRLVDILKGEVTFVQIGELSSGHFHPALRGVVDLRGADQYSPVLPVDVPGIGCGYSGKFPHAPCGGLSYSGRALAALHRAGRRSRACNVVSVSGTLCFPYGRGAGVLSARRMLEVPSGRMRGPGDGRRHYNRGLHECNQARSGGGDD